MMWFILVVIFVFLLVTFISYNKPNTLILISVIVIIISTIGFGILIPTSNSNIITMADEIAEKDTAMESQYTNFYDGSWLLRIIALIQGQKQILEELDSVQTEQKDLYINAFLDKMIFKFSQDKTIKQKIKDYTLEEKLELARELRDRLADKINKISEDKKTLKLNLNQKRKARNELNIKFVIVQVFGLLIGAIGSFKKK